MNTAVRFPISDGTAEPAGHSVLLRTLRLKKRCGLCGQLQSRMLCRDNVEHGTADPAGQSDLLRTLRFLQKRCGTAADCSHGPCDGRHFAITADKGIKIVNIIS